MTSAIPRSSVLMNAASSTTTSDSIVDTKTGESNIRAPGDYMFARSDFTKSKEKLDEVLNTGVLFRYHMPDAKNIPVA
jgi:hypothetical protein